MRSPTWRIALVILALAGASVSYSLQLSAGGAAGGLFARLCTVGARTDCAPALLSAWGRIGPIPTATAGVCYFSILALWYAVCGLPNRAGRWWHVPAVAVALAGGGMSVLLMGYMLFRLPAWCPACAVVHGLNGVLVVGTLLVWPRRVEARPAGGAAPVPARPNAARVATTVALAFAWGLAAVAYFSARFYYVESGVCRGAWLESTNNADYVLWRHEIAPAVDVPVRDDDPAVGPATAPHVLVVFMDFQCPHCREFEAFAPRILEWHGDRLRIVFKHYPMSRMCSAELPEAHDIHRFACEAAMAAEAARRAGDAEQAWRYRHALFQNGARFAERPWKALAAALKLDVARFEAEMSSAGIRDRISEDVALARRLDIRGSGAMFLDGQRLESWRIVTADSVPQTDELATLRLWERLLGEPAAAAR